MPDTTRQVRSDVIFGAAWIIAMLVILLFASIAHTQPAQPIPDRRDYMLSTLQAQRNAAMDQAAICQGDNGLIIEALRRENADLKAKLAEKPKE